MRPAIATGATRDTLDNGAMCRQLASDARWHARPEALPPRVRSLLSRSSDFHPNGHFLALWRSDVGLGAAWAKLVKRAT